MSRCAGVVLLQVLAMSLPAQAQAVRVSMSSSGTEGNRDSWDASVSPDGRYVAFISDASNLAPQDQDTCSDLFVHDRLFETTDLVGPVSGYCGGLYAKSIRRPLIRGVSSELLFFQSTAKNLDTRHTYGWGLFVTDLADDTTRLVDDLGECADDLYTYSASSDGRFLSYLANDDRISCSRLLSAYLHDRAAGLSQVVSVSADGRVVSAVGHTYASDDGHLVTFASDDETVVPDDTNRVTDVFIRDIAQGTTRRVSVDEQGQQLSAQTLSVAMSPSGRYVVILELQSLNRLWLYDGETGLGQLLFEVPFNPPTGTPLRIWADDAHVDDVGTQVLFSAEASGGGTTIWSVDSRTAEVKRLEVATPDGGTAYMAGVFSASRDGTVVAFASPFARFVSDDTNNSQDVFVVDLTSAFAIEAGDRPGTAAPDTSTPGLNAGSLACPSAGFVSLMTLGLLGFWERRRAIC